MNSKNKILVVSNMYPDTKHPSYGVFVEKFCRQLETTGIYYTLSVMHKSDNVIEKALRYLLFYSRTFFEVLCGKYDLIYVHYPSFSGAPVDLANHIRHRKIYTNLHGSDVIPESHVHERMQKYTRKLVARSEKIIVPSDYFKEVVVTKYGVKEEFVYIYPSGGIDKKIFHAKQKEEIDRFKRKYGIHNCYPILGFAGRIIKDKGWDVFVDAASNIRGNVNFLIVGTGYEDSLLEKKIQELKLDTIWIKKLLSQDELSLFYSACDFFVFPTKRDGESLGLVAIEAMACGTPVIASDYAAPRFYIKDGYNGFKFVMGSSRALAEKMNKALLLSDADRIKLNHGAVSTAEHYFCENLQDSFSEIFK